MASITEVRRLRNNCSPSRPAQAVAAIPQILSDDHKRCDALFAQCEAAVLEQHWVAAAACHAQFCRAVDAHLAAEESVLFPAFESAIAGWADAGDAEGACVNA